jgi:LAO/AO transport system kinase
VAARRLRARRLTALDEFTVENGERALRELGGRRAAERWLREQDEALDVPGLVAALEQRAR